VVSAKPLWEGSYREPVIRDGKLEKVRRSVILGTVADMRKSAAPRRVDEILRPLNDGLHAPECESAFSDLPRRWEQEIVPNVRDSTGGF